MISHPLYREDISYLSSLDLPYNELKGKTILISGSSGLLGSVLVDSFMEINEKRKLGLKVIALGRNESKAKDLFSPYWGKPSFSFLSHDVNEPLNDIGHVDFVIHLASVTHPLGYSTKPIETILSNTIGTKNLLDLASNSGCRRFVLASSVEIYGENRGDRKYFTEDYCGYIDPNSLRAGYPESKRCAEALCQAYRKEKGIEVVIPRLARSFGPSLKKDDSKAMSQFLHNAISGEDIVLKSEGKQFYSYTYAADAVAGILFCLLKGEDGEAYNVADESCDIALADLAKKIAGIAGTKVIFDLPSEAERAGFSKATLAVMDGSKIKSLGWKAHFVMEEGLRRTIEILKEAK